MTTHIYTVKQKGQVNKPLGRKVSDVAGMLHKYKKSKPASIEEMDQAIERNIRGSQN